MDFEYYEELLTKHLGKSAFDKDKPFWIKVYNSAERRNLLSTLEEIIGEFKYQKLTSVIDNPSAYLTTLVKKEIPLDETSITRFEGNLVENPFYRPGRRSNEPIVFKNTRIDSATHIKVNTEWTATSESMVPNEEDADVFKVLLQIFHESGMPDSGEVLFTRYDICKRLKKPTTGPSYRQITNALKYIFDTKITSKQAFLKYKEKIFLNTMSESEYIRLIDSYKLMGADNDADGSKEMFKSRVILGRYIVENMKLYYSVNIDWKFYIDLRFPLAKRLYEYLQKKRGKDKKGAWKERLLSLAEKMAMSTKTPRNIKHNLKPALEELKFKDYLNDFSISKVNKEEMLTISFKDGLSLPKFEFEAEES